MNVFVSVIPCPVFMQEAKLTELKKEVDTLSEELKCATDTVSVLVLSLVAAEEFVSTPATHIMPNSYISSDHCAYVIAWQMMGHDEELARKSKASREQHVGMLKAKGKESRAATDSYRFASAENVSHLNVSACVH